MVKCIEEINVPTDLLIRVENKNSLIRKGITIVSPVYNPGHKTPIYLRVDNISPDTFRISKNLCIAQMVFEQLSSKPIHTYDQQVMHHSIMNGNTKDYLITKIIMKKERTTKE